MIPNTQIQVTGQVQALGNPLEQGPSPNSRPDFTFPSVYSFSSRGRKLLSLSLSATKVHKVRASLTADPSLAPDFENSESMMEVGFTGLHAKPQARTFAW